MTPKIYGLDFLENFLINISTKILNHHEDDQSIICSNNYDC